MDKIQTGTFGTPLLEQFELTFGEYTRVELPPSLYLGKFIEDINQTERSVKEGVFMSGMFRRRPPTIKNYHLMDIHFNIPMIDANCLEARPGKSKFPGIKFGNDIKYELCNVE